MAHGRRAGPISDIVAPSPPLRSGLTPQGGEDQRRLVNGDKDHLTPAVPADQYYTSREPSPEDMEDTCSEYDNVGSDVEQDCEQVLHLSREAVADVRYGKQVCAEDEVSRAVERHAPRSRHSTETLKGLQSGAKPEQASRSFRPYRAPPGKAEAQRGVEKGHENRFLFSDGDEMEEVLDGARFIEDLDDAASSVPAQTLLCQDSEKERIRKRGDDASRKKNVPAGCKRREAPHVDSKERQGKGRGRRATGEDTERGSTSEQRPKTSSKESRKGSVRSKARSGRQHPPPSPRHSDSPANTQKARHHGETPPEATPSSAASPDSRPRVVEPSLAHPHASERPEELLEDAQAGPAKSQQVSGTTEQDRVRHASTPHTRTTIRDAHVHAEYSKVHISGG